MSVEIGISFSEPIMLKLQSLAKDRPYTEKDIIVQAVEEFILREDAVRLRDREAQEAWKDFECTSMGVPHDEMRTWLVSLSEGKNIPCPLARPLK